MATVTMTLESICAGQGHVHIDVSVNAGPTQSYRFTVEDLLAPITEDDRETIIRGLLRVHAIGRTRAQMRADLVAGINMTV